MYQRDDIIRSNSLPPMDVMHSSVYQTSLRERFNSLDGYYSVACQQPSEPRTTVPLPRVSDDGNRNAAVVKNPMSGVKPPRYISSLLHLLCDV